jgi:type II secretory pathway pseudopilin PulG
LIKIRPERDRLRQALCKYESLTSREETEKQLDSNIQLKRNELQELDLQQAAIRTSIKKLQAKLREHEAKEYLISIEDYEPKYYYFVDSGDCLQGLKDIALKQERMRDTNQAFICDTKWSIGEGKKGENRGKQMTKDILKMMEFAFEKQCKYARKEVSYNNVDKFKKQINDSFNIINKYFQKIECRISEEYLNLKLRELDLQYELEEIKQKEKEIERAIQEQMKQEKKERFQIEKAQQEAEEAEQRERQYQEQIERIRRLEETNVSGLDKEEYENQIKDLEEQLTQAKTAKEKSKEKVILYSEKLKSGYIYVISNIGSLGRDVYRIFMTKNNNPDAYIRTMNPYLPFPFDVHYKIFSDNASETVKHLHQKFNDRRVNIENERREFFKVSFNEIEQVVQEIDIDTDTVTLTIQKFERVPQAYEYRRTKAAERKNSYDTTLIDGYIDEDEIA